MGIDDIQQIQVLFSDCSEKVRNIIINSFIYSSEYDIEHTQNLLHVIYEIKCFFPEFTIEYNENIVNSCFSQKEKKIYLNTDNVITFFHELTHAIYYFKKNSETPGAFLELYEGLFTDDNFVNRCIDVINTVKKDVDLELFYCYLNNSSKKFINVNNSASDEIFVDKNSIGGEEKYLIKNNLSPKYKSYAALFDIIDALVGGVSYDQGLSFLKDNNTYIKKSLPESGHGSEYYNEFFGRRFNEIIANYSSIRNTPYKKNILSLLRYCCGDELVDFLEDYYVNLTGSMLQNIDKYGK